MRILTTLGIIWLGFSLVAGVFAYRVLAFERIEEPTSVPYAYQVLSQSGQLKLAINEPGWLKVTVRNTGQQPWQVTDLRLGAVYTNGVPRLTSQFATTVWEASWLVPAATDQSVIEPLEKVVFKVPVQATAEAATYQESFRVRVGAEEVVGPTINWLIQIGDDLKVAEGDDGGKRIVISLDKQRLWAIENHVVVMSIPVSTGMPGYDTPKGRFTIANHAPKAYSAKYQLYMDNWMAMAGPNSTQLQGYGIHKLPSWKVASGGKYWRATPQYIGSRYYENGWIYEDATHLGQKMSHGCVRVGIAEAPVLYDWATNGTPIDVA